MCKDLEPDRNHDSLVTDSVLEGSRDSTNTYQVPLVVFLGRMVDLGTRTEKSVMGKK
jgi:hypothetical protein